MIVSICLVYRFNYSKELCSAKRNIMYIIVICFFYAIVICLKSYFYFQMQILSLY